MVLNIIIHSGQGTWCNLLSLPSIPFLGLYPVLGLIYCFLEKKKCTGFQWFFTNSDDVRESIYFLSCLNSCGNVQENEATGKPAPWISVLLMKKILASQDFPSQEKSKYNLVVQYNLRRHKTLPVTSSVWSRLPNTSCRAADGTENHFLEMKMNYRTEMLMGWQEHHWWSEKNIISCGV